MNDMTNGNGSSGARRKIRAAARGTKWLVPITALAAIALSLLRLTVTPERWLNESVCDAAAGIARFAPDPAPCLALAGVALAYWVVKERDEAAAALGTLAGWLTGIPGVDRLIPLGIKGLTIMFATIKKMMYEQIREEGRERGLEQGREEGLERGLERGLEQGREEGREENDAEWDDWLQRRMATGDFVPDDNDPPPSQRRD